MAVALFHSAVIDLTKGLVLVVDAVSPHPDLNTLEKYVAADIAWCENAHYFFIPVSTKAKPKKTHACGRTMSWAKYAGSKQNKPKHFWGKKKRARKGWSV